MLISHKNKKPAKLSQPIVHRQDIFTLGEAIPPGESREYWVWVALAGITQTTSFPGCEPKSGVAHEISSTNISLPNPSLSPGRLGAFSLVGAQTVILSWNYLSVELDS